MKQRRKKKVKKPLFSHHSKTGRHLPHRHTSYPAMLMVLLLVMFIVVGLNFKISAADVGVNAYVDGPPPSGPATILSPSDGAVFTSIPITVSGTCPIGGGNMVKIYRNGIFSGAVLCSLSGTFQLQTALFAGNNLLESKVFNAVDVEGPASTPITVTYNPPPAPPSPTSKNGNKNNPTNPVTDLLISTENAYRGYFTGDEISWELDILGGTAPYAITVNWGDGGLSTVSRKSTGKFKISHTYQKAGPIQGSYNIKINATDSADKSAFIQLVVVVRDKDSMSAATPASGSSDVPPFDGLFSYKIALPIYSGLVLLMLSFWLGERQELHKLKSLVNPNRSKHA
jgi:hypothetical protein